MRGWLVAGLVVAVTAGDLKVAPTRQAWAAPWRAFQGGGGRAGVVEEQALPPLTEAWRVHVPGGVVSSPVAAYGKVYFGTRSGEVYALDAQTGAVVWQYSTEGWVDSTPCVANGILYVSCRDGRLYALDAGDGSVRWSFQTGGSDTASPLVDGGLVYAAAGFPAKMVYALDAVTGALRWTADMPQPVYSSPALVNGVLYIGVNGGRYVALDAKTGVQRWAAQPASGGLVYHSVPAVAGGLLYAAPGGDDLKVYALDANTGQTRYTSPTLGAPPKSFTTSSLAVADGAVYVAAGYFVSPGLVLYALPVDLSTVTWSRAIGVATKASLTSSPLVADDVAYVGSGDGSLYALDLASAGAVMAQVSLGKPILATPCVADGWVYAGIGLEDDGWLVALRPSVVTSLHLDSEAPVHGTLAIRGTVSNAALTGYLVERGEGASPTAWTAVAGGTAPVSNAALANLDTTAVKDGLYTFRLTATAGGAPRLNRALVWLNIFNVYLKQLVQSAVGATLTSSDGTRLVIPPGALPADVEVTVQKKYPGEFPAGGFDDDALPTNAVRDVSLASPMVLRQPVTLRIPYSPEEAMGAPERGLKVFSWNPTRGRWEFEPSSRPSPEEHAVYASPAHLSLFRAAYAVRASALVGPGGLTFGDPDGTEVVVPVGALPAADTLTINKPASYPTGGVTASWRTPLLIGGLDPTVRQFSAAATAVFQATVTVKIPYDPSWWPGGNEAALRLCYWDGARGEWRIVNTTEGHPEESPKRIYAGVFKPGIFRILEFRPGGALLDPAAVYAYPNPATGDRAGFKFWLGDKADVTIGIFDVAGQQVAELAGSYPAGGRVEELGWDIRNVASGVYIFRLEAKGSAGTAQVVKKKMAVVK